MSNVSKETMRQFFMAKRNGTDVKQLEEWSCSITNHILDYVMRYHLGTVMVYADFRREPKTSALIEKLLELGVRVCLPKCEKDGKMEAYTIESVRELTPGRFGILEPAGEIVLKPEEIELVLVPGYGFDRSRNRLGYGGGYYDRFLPRCTKAVIAGVCYGNCLVESLPADPFDVKMDLLITEDGCLI
ncbi:MAG: 5-formyltetrahydrofolate cyclo-ligase [Clostridia bacterium]|nr:5-formyltetrahydrofolate cyclo-ligase [Clostridia bacterium]